MSEDGVGVVGSRSAAGSKRRGATSPTMSSTGLGGVAISWSDGGSRGRVRPARRLSARSMSSAVASAAAYRPARGRLLVFSSEGRADGEDAATIRCGSGRFGWDRRPQGRPVGANPGSRGGPRRVPSARSTEAAVVQIEPVHPLLVQHRHRSPEFRRQRPGCIEELAIGANIETRHGPGEPLGVCIRGEEALGRGVTSSSRAPREGSPRPLPASMKEKSSSAYTWHPSTATAVGRSGKSGLGADPVRASSWPPQRQTSWPEEGSHMDWDGNPGCSPHGCLAPLGLQQELEAPCRRHRGADPALARWHLAPGHQPGAITSATRMPCSPTLPVASHGR